MSLSLESETGLRPAARARPSLAAALRYGLTTAGPLATSAAHFLASLLFVHNLPPDQFGLFSFVLVIVPFAMSASGALLVIPVTRALTRDAAARAATRATCLKANLFVALAVALMAGTALAIAGAAIWPALLLGLFGGALTGRWFARCLAYVEGQSGRAVASDLVYGAGVATGLGLLAFLHRLSLADGAAVMLAAALLAHLPLGRRFLAAQVAAIRGGRLAAYRALFMDLTRWSLLGVVFTEMTANAHAYLVTFASGPGAFALLALGMLLMRPASLVQSALPDMERPAMTRRIAARDWTGLARLVREFRAGLLAVWLATLLADAALLLWLPGLILKKGYSLHDVGMVLALSALILALRGLRGPPAVLLQAAGAFRELAGIGLKCSAVSIAATLTLLIAFGPVASLGGIVAGELAILYFVHGLVKDWEAHRDD